MSEKSRDPLRPVRDFLYQVRDGHREIMNLENRIALRRHVLEMNCGDEMEKLITRKEIEEMESNLNGKKRVLASTVLNVSDMISRLHDINQQMVLTYRYIDMISDWNVIADKMGMRKAAVQKIHGRALPILQKALLKLENVGQCY